MMSRLKLRPTKTFCGINLYQSLRFEILLARPYLQPNRETPFYFRPGISEENRFCGAGFPPAVLRRGMGTRIAGETPAPQKSELGGLS